MVFWLADKLNLESQDSLSSIALKLSLVLRWVLLPVIDFIEKKIHMNWGNSLPEIFVLFVALDSVSISIFLTILITLENVIFNTLLFYVNFNT